MFPWQTQNKLTSSVSVFSEQIYTLNGRLAPVLTYANRHVSILLDKQARSSRTSPLRKKTGTYSLSVMEATPDVSF